MAEVIDRRHGRRRRPTESKRRVQPYVIVNIILVVGLAAAAFALTR